MVLERPSELTGSCCWDWQSLLYGYGDY